MSPCVDVLLSCDELRQSIMILQGTLTCCSTGLTVPCRPCPHNFHKRILIVKRLIMTLARLIPEPHLVGYITGGLAQCRNHSHAIFMKFFRKYTYKHVYLHEKMLHYMSVESCFHGKSCYDIVPTLQPLWYNYCCKSYDKLLHYCVFGSSYDRTNVPGCLERYQKYKSISENMKLIFSLYAKYSYISAWDILAHFYLGIGTKVLKMSSHNCAGDKRNL